MAAAITTSDLQLRDIADRARSYTNNVEFDYIHWTINATWIKVTQNALGMPYYLTRETRHQVMLEYNNLTRRILQAENELRLIYSDPNISDPETVSSGLREELFGLYSQQSNLAPFAESILQEQISIVLSELGLTLGGQPIPPVLYNSSPLPLSLVISPRDRIQQDAGISLLPDLTVDQQAAIEDSVDHDLDVSSLVVPVGGIGTYPTMVMRTDNLSWLADTVAHEWIHNYLSLRPLGILYEESPALRTMNETAASIAGNEIGKQVMITFFPELAYKSNPNNQNVRSDGSKADPNDIPRKPFNPRAELHLTRVTVDGLLAEGKVEEAEEYMEQRRELFWANGYPIRKLNQAYFAFYGAYAAVPGGAAGQDPVGPAVRTLRELSTSLAEFVNRISWMTSFEQLQREITQ